MDQTRRTPENEYEIALHPGQARALASTKLLLRPRPRFYWQSGKTVIGPPWLFREIKTRGPGDYLIASPTYPLMMKKVLPEFLRLFRRTFQLGEFVGQPRNCFTFSAAGCKRLFGRMPDVPTQVFFGHARDPESLESATYKGAWLDEAGQNDFRLTSWEAILGRLSINEGARAHHDKVSYNLGWLKQLFWDAWLAAGRNHTRIDIVHFRSIDNPAFPRAEYDRAKAEMPGWKFRMCYDGVFERPAGVIYDCFRFPQTHLPRPFRIRPDWPRYLGLDFGGQNTAGVFFAEAPDGKVYAYREYGPTGGRTASQHAAALLRGRAGPARSACGRRQEWQQQWARRRALVARPACPWASRTSATSSRGSTASMGRSPRAS